MKCSICKSENAIIHIREYTESGLRKINLCLECAIKKGLSAPAENIDALLAKIITNVFNITTNYKNKASKKSFKLVCPSCGKTINDFSMNLEVGCPICYDVFEDIIDLLIFNQNNSLTYLGKLPDNLNKLNSQKNTLRQLKKDLKRHINTEEFTKAAFVRDEIKKLKKRINREIRKIEN
jgi:protein arginine kinase activator